MVTWQKDGQELDEDVELEKMVPNGDGTFQTRSHLMVNPEDWKRDRYTCTVQHKSLEQDIILPVTEENIRRNHKTHGNPDSIIISMGMIIGCVVVLLLTVIVCIILKRKSGYKKTSTADVDSVNSTGPVLRQLPDLKDDGCSNPTALSPGDNLNANVRRSSQQGCSIEPCVSGGATLPSTDATDTTSTTGTTSPDAEGSGQHHLTPSVEDNS
ncbi:hypothetical protein GJAV_G00106170 [Gymnothorax javanicus]|nr:hypothetical protein GJAV_G00106170 [Gymnothorax javanicus]